METQDRFRSQNLQPIRTAQTSPTKARPGVPSLSPAVTHQLAALRHGERATTGSDEGTPSRHLVYPKENETTAMASAVCITESRPCPLTGTATRQAIRLLTITWETLVSPHCSLPPTWNSRVLIGGVIAHATTRKHDRTEPRNGDPDGLHVTDSQDITGHSPV